MVAQPLDARWNAVLSRDKSADGQFVLGVVTTGIYCRPSCPSRKPKPENVRFFTLPALAEDAGFRPCKRCHPREAVMVSPQARLVQAVCDYIRAHAGDADALSLEQIGAAVGYTTSHIAHTFKAMLGMTPRQYAETQRMQHLRRNLRAGGTVTDAIYAAGYGSSSRVYERSDQMMGMTPAAYQRGGQGVTITYTISPCSFGMLLVGMTGRGVCEVGIYDDAESAAAGIRAEFPNATLIHDDARLLPVVQAILDHVDGRRAALDLPLDVQATAFQQRVWDELRRIPRGETRTYAQIAQALGKPKAVRAVAHACASNHAAIIIPCHRVIGSDGSLRGYKWGISRKQALLKAERA
jgi:AraC family transcriptional regulator of adaptative response/methylated-DNA-[protein]-cysteine methyltransferase